MITLCIQRHKTGVIVEEELTDRPQAFARAMALHKEGCYAVVVKGGGDPGFPQTIRGKLSYFDGR